MFHARAVVAIAVSYAVLVMPVAGSTTSALGTITSASRASVGSAAASTGSTVFGGDHLSTDVTGNIQVRTGAARLRLSGASSVSMGEDNGIPAATLLSGTAVFSTANAKAFELRAATALIRAESDRPTVGQVTYVSPKELRVRSTRGSLAITVDGETQIVPEATAYRVILDPSSYYANEDPQGPQGVGGGKYKGPRKAGRSRFLLIAIVAVSVATGVALYEAYQSPSAP